MPSLSFDYHKVLKLNSILLLFRPDNDSNNQKHAKEVNVQIISYLGDTVVQPETRDEYQETSASDRLDMLPFHRRNNTQVYYQDKPG